MTTAATPLPSPDASPWLQSPAWDGVWLHSGLWLVPVAIGLTALPGWGEVLLVVSVFALWLPHRFATAFNAFCTPAYAELLTSRRWRFVILPGLVLSLTFVFVFAPSWLVPWASDTRAKILATIFLGYNAWHFAMQHYGVLSIYRQRARQRATPAERRWERGFCLAVGLVAVLLAQMGHGAEVVESSLLGDAPALQGVSIPLWSWRLIVPTLVLIAWAVFYWHESQQTTPSTPRKLYGTALAAQGVLGYWLPAPEFFLLWGVQHWLVSVGLAGHMAERDHGAIDGRNRWYRSWRRVTSGFGTTVLTLCLTTLVLVPFFDLSVHPENSDLLPIIGPMIVYLLSNAFWAKLFIALNFGTVFVHFAMDRAVFRFSDPATREVTGRLLFAK